MSPPADSGPWLLTVDRGNSTLDCMLRGPEIDRARLSTEDISSFERFLAGRRPSSAVGLSVVRRGLDAVEQHLVVLGVQLRIAGRDLPCPLNMGYRTPDTLGVDRWVSAFAAHREHGQACIVDMGTTTTVDLVDRQGVYRGGAIAPGFAALLTSMSSAPQLPAANPLADFDLPPTTTADAVAMGVQVGYCGMVERLVGDVVGVARSMPTVVITGGAASYYLRHGRLAAVHMPDLVHRGLGLLVGEPCAS